MAKAKIITDAGTKIILEGSIDEVKEIVNYVKGGEISKTPKKKKKKQKEEQKEEQKRYTATDMILSFRESGYFNKPKNLLEIKKALEEQGMIYPVTTLSSILLNLVRKRLLGRIDVNKKWCYVKR